MAQTARFGMEEMQESLKHDNLEEFHHPEEYDAQYGSDVPKRVEFLAGLISTKGAKVLDLCCGTGSVSIALALAGCDVTGVDLSTKMLERASLKCTQAGASVGWLKCDALAYEGTEKFDLIFMAGNAFQAFLTDADQRRLLDVVRRNLTPTGLYVFDVRNPITSDLRSYSSEEYWGTYENAEGCPVTESGTQHYDVITKIMHWTTYRRWFAHGMSRSREARIACRFSDVEELRAILQGAELRIVAQHDDWGNQPLSLRGERIVTICAAAQIR